MSHFHRDPWRQHFKTGTSGAGGDVLNLHDVLDTFAGITPVTHANAFSGGYPLLALSASGTDILAQIDSDGSADASSFVTSATL